MNIIQNKKTKIVATIGPSSNKAERIARMVEQGLTLIRINFSHGTHEEHIEEIKAIRKAEKIIKKPIPILQDLCGPKIRIGEMKENVFLESGKSIIVTSKPYLGDEKKISINYPNLSKEINIGAVIKIEDGKKELKVEKIHGSDIHCKIIIGGKLSSRKGINLPGTKLSISALTSKDKRDIIFGIEQDVDFIALSFVQSAQDIKDLRKILAKYQSKAHIIAKIETTSAVQNIDEIIKVSDGIMVARGDMAVEVGVEEVPLIQKTIIQKCNRAGKPVITATQMLDSMEKNPVPTRAEVSDVANAIIDGTDAIMLSGESAIGDYPEEAIITMTAIAKRTEPYNKNTHLEYIDMSQEVVDTISVSTVRIANNIRARLIISLTESGFTPRMIARFKPHHGIIAITPHEDVLRKLQLVYGCYPVLSKISGNINKVSKEIQKLVKKYNWASKGEKIVVTAGTPFGKVGSTDTIFIVEAI